MLEAVLCLAVFLFAFHAKTSMYGSSHTSHVSPSTSAKLWLNGQKSEVEAKIQPAPVLLWFAILFLHWLCLHREPFCQRLTDPPVARPLVLQDVHHSLRPPPISQGALSRSHFMLSQ